MITIYTDKVKGGEVVDFLPIVLINPKYKNDKGLHKHEYTHVLHWAIMFAITFPIVFLISNWFWALIAGITIHDALYHILPKFRLWSEITCYRVQLKYSPQHLEHFVKFICNDYNLNINADYVRKKLVTK